VPGRDRDARRRADRRVDVELLEAEALAREAVDVRGLCGVVAEAGEVAPASIISEYYNNIWLPKFVCLNKDSAQHNTNNNDS